MMNKFLIALAAMLFAVSTMADRVRLEWTPSPSMEVNGYKIYYGNASGSYTNTVFVVGQQTTNCAVSNLVRGATYYFAATATTPQGIESDFSNEVSYSVPVVEAAHELRLVGM